MWSNLHYQLCLIFLIGLLGYPTKKSQAQEVHWLSFEEAVEKNQQDPRPIFIDVYTNWCGWCKKMDKTTFSHPVVARYLNDKYHPVKLNAERRDTVRLGDKVFAFRPDMGRKGTHELAASLLNGRMSYPTVVFLNEKFQMLSPIPGYRRAKEMDALLKFFGEGYYEEQEFEEFKETYKSPVK